MEDAIPFLSYFLATPMHIAHERRNKQLKIAKVQQWRLYGVGVGALIGL